jgi:hypothetical protein
VTSRRTDFSKKQKVSDSESPCSGIEGARNHDQQQVAHVCINRDVWRPAVSAGFSFKLLAGKKPVSIHI